jgi:hypothetical protein
MFGCISPDGFIHLKIIEAMNAVDPLLSVALVEE